MTTHLWPSFVKQQLTEAFNQNWKAFLFFFSSQDLKNTCLGLFFFFNCFWFCVLLCSHVWSAESQESFPAQFCATVKLIALKSCSYKTSAYLGASLSSVWRSGLWRAAQDNKKVLQHLHDLTPPCQRGSAVLRCSSCSIPVPLRAEPGGSLTGGRSLFTVWGRETGKSKQSKSLNSRYSCFSCFSFPKSYHVNAV